MTTATRPPTDPPPSPPGAAPLRRPPGRPVPDVPVLDVVVPVHNEQAGLGPCVRRVHRHLTETLPYPFRITIADNASTDATPVIAAALAAELAQVRVLRLADKGRGRALRAAWAGSDAVVLAYLDADLSTDLAALLPMVAPLISGHSDLAIGTRLARGARVVRGPKRELLSRGYNLLLRGALAAGFSDAQCGFKAVRADVAAQLLPLVRDDGWFFDTELLVLAERAGLRIHEVPVDWIDDPDSRVNVLATALEDLRGIARLGWALLTGAVPLGELRARAGRHPLVPGGLGSQLLRFVVVGVLSTLAYLLLFALLRRGLAAQPANLVALLVTAVANTAFNRTFTFGVRGRARAVRHHAQALVLFAVGLGMTSGALAVLHATSPAAGTSAELAVLLAATGTAGMLRFLLLRAWVFGSGGTGPVPAPAAVPVLDRSAR